MSDLNKIPTLEEFINEEVMIPPELATRYLGVKKQMADKQAQKEALLKQVNQKDTEMGILQKNLIAIESEASKLQGKTPAPQQEKPAGATPTTGQTTPAGQVNAATESVVDNTIEGILMEWEELDERLFGKKIDPLKPFADAMEELYPEDSEDFGIGNPNYGTDRFNSEDLPEEDPIEYPEESEDFGIGDPNYGTDQDRFNESVDDDDIDILHPLEVEDTEDDEEVGEISPDYLFAVRVKDPVQDEDIIAKVYRNEDDDFWKIRVVQGDEEPLEAMQFDPEMKMVDIIERLAEIYDEVVEVDVEDYEDMIDDKEENDEKFYGKEKMEKVKEKL